MAISSKFTGFTALSGTADILLGGAALELPDGAREIVAMMPVIYSPAGNTAAESVAAKAWLTSEDLKINPYYVLAQPIGSSLLKSVAQVQGKNTDVMYPVNCPCKGGENIKCYGTGLFDHTIEPYMAILLIYSSVPAMDRNGHKIPQVKAKVGTLTGTGTSAARTTGSNISIVGCSKIIEAFGFAYGTTVAALKGLGGHFDLQSEGFTPYPWTIDLPINPASGQVDTNIQEAIAGVARIPVDIPTKNKLTINDAFTLAVALTTAGKWIVGVLYN